MNITHPSIPAKTAVGNLFTKVSWTNTVECTFGKKCTSVFTGVSIDIYTPQDLTRRAATHTDKSMNVISVIIVAVKSDC